MKVVTLEDEMRFKTKTKSNMDFDEVYMNINNFMIQNPMGNYTLMIGTDSQVVKEGTLFTTGIGIHRYGYGAWACRRSVLLDRRIEHLHEKISTETSLSEQLAFMFLDGKIDTLEEIILPHIYRGAFFDKEIHLDIGDKPQNKTNEFVNEMVSRVESLGFKALIKPHSLMASGFANKYTKIGG